MGLKVSHGAYEGPYSSFNRFRKFIIASIGGSYPPHEKENLDEDRWYWDTDRPFSSETHPGLKEFFCHSDCEGEIQPEMCKVVADELESILPYIEAREAKDRSAGGLLMRGGYVQITKEFIEGCREAYKKNEPLEFM